MVARITHRLLSLLQLLLVLLYILFEELIWEGIAKPIYERVHALKILQKIEMKLQQTHAVVILLLFIVLLVTVEAFGIYAGMLFVGGHIVLGLGLYLTKIPIAAFTFWLFRVSEAKLMQFGWFRWLYERVMALIAWLKGLDIYQETMVKLKQIKAKLKGWIVEIKARYFKEESPFVARLKRHYKTLKAYLDR